MTCTKPVGYLLGRRKNEETVKSNKTKYLSKCFCTKTRNNCIRE